MYNTLFGINNFAASCLASVYIFALDVERFRDAIFFKKGNKYFVEVLTRTGGENRKNFPNLSLKKNKNYIEDYDDKFDKTYAHFIFQIPDKIAKNIYWDRIFKDQTRNSLDLKKMFEKEFREMEIPGTEAHKRAEQMARGLESIFNKTENDNKVHVITPEEIMKEGENNGRKR